MVPEPSMSAHSPGRFHECQTFPTRPEYLDLQSWPVDPALFYEVQVKQVLTFDVPARVRKGGCRIWLYHDASCKVVGCGTLDLCRDYSLFTGGKPHYYIPVLGVHAFQRGKGYGGLLLNHLLGRATLLAQQRAGAVSDLLFLDVYVANQDAIRQYRKKQFVSLNEDEPIPDPEQSGEKYIVMAAKLDLVPPVISMPPTVMMPPA